MDDISHLSREQVGRYEEISRSDAEHGPSRGRKCVVPTDVVSPLGSLGSMMIALIFEDQSAGGDRKIGMQNSGADLQRLVDSDAAETQLLDHQAQERFRSRVASPTRAGKRERAAPRSTSTGVTARDERQVFDRREWFPIPGTQEMVGGCHEIGDCELCGELTPDVSG